MYQKSLVLDKEMGRKEGLANKEFLYWFSPLHWPKE
jgi:hypothetical protein